MNGFTKLLLFERGAMALGSREEVSCCCQSHQGVSTIRANARPSHIRRWPVVRGVTMKPVMICRLMLKFRFVRQSFMPLRSHLGGGILPQDAGGGLTLSERQLTITRQLSTAQAIRYSRRQRPVAVIRSQNLSLTVLPIPVSGLLQRTGSRSLVDRRANRQHKREARDG